MPSAAETAHQPGRPNEAWLESLSPWPEEFGLERMQALLAELGNPERSFRSIHVVGSNGKTTATKLIEALLVREGLRASATISPHVRGWSERITVGGVEADLERALGRVRPASERIGATQFETITAAALAEFAFSGVKAAAVEAGLGGRYDATNVLESPVVVLTNVALEHTQWLGSTREAIAREKLAVIAPGAAVVLGEAEWGELARSAGAGSVTLGSSAELPRKAVELLLGREIAADPVSARIPGRLEWRGEGELWDGAHNPAGMEWLVDRLRAEVQPGKTGARPWTVVCSILADKDVSSMLRSLATVSRALVATASSNPRALPAAKLAALAEDLFDSVEIVDDPLDALVRARSVAGPGGLVLATGSLYLLADLASREEAVY